MKNGLKSNKKMIVGTIIVGIILLGGADYAYNRHNQTVKAEDAQHKLEEKNKRLIESAKEEVSTLYADEKREALANDLSKGKIGNALNKVEQVKDEIIKIELVKEISDVRILFDTQTMVKGFLKDGVLVDDVDETKITLLNESVAKAKTINIHIVSILNNDVVEINSQFNTINAAREKVYALFTNLESEKVKDKVTKEQYNEGKEMVDKIKNTKAKAELSGLLNKVNDALKAIEEQEKAQAMAKQKAEREKQVSQEKKSGSIGEKNKAATSGSQKEQSGFAGIVTSSATAQKTDQIVTVVASGTSAQVSLFEKSNGIWKEVIKTSGHVGSMGVGKASEYVSRTPRGSYRLGFAFGTSNPGTQLPFRKITPNSYWISNVKDPQYNTWQERESSDKADEHLANYPVQYRYAIVINYNNGVGGGSGFFLHVDNGKPTAGCVSVPASVMVQFMKRIHSGAYIINVTSQSEVGNY